MSSSERIQAFLSESEGRRSFPVGRAAQLMFGGAIGGGFIGSFVGAILGMAVGAFSLDVSQGLDGAVIGLVLASLAGGSYGIYLARRDARRAPSPDDQRELTVRP